MMLTKYYKTKVILMIYYVKIAAIGVVTGLCNGLFGSGGGTILVPALVFIMDIEDHKAHATAISVILPLAAVSAFIYYKNDIVDISLTLKVLVGGVVGSYVGAKLLNKLSSKSLRRIFGIFMIIAAIRMVL